MRLPLLLPLLGLLLALGGHASSFGPTGSNVTYFGAPRFSIEGVLPVFDIAESYIRSQTDSSEKAIGFKGLGGCSAKDPCILGSCCNSDGQCGYRPEHCSPLNPKTCVANCDAKAPCGEFSADGKTSCPLNACCSRLGFCGTSDVFCRDAAAAGGDTPCLGGNCGAIDVPSCGKNSDSASRRVAYYQSWNSRRRNCDKVMPSQLDLSGITHLVLAFATIDSTTFQVRLMNPDDGEIYKQFLALPDNVSKWIGIGGFEFTDPGPTQHTWSDMASNQQNRKTFIDSLKQFCSTWNFRGVDIDWEWPGHESRGGNAQDGANQVELVKELRQAFGNDFGIGVVIPAQYDYMKNMDPKGLEAQVNWLSILTYDMHGAWDASIPGLGPKIKPHTDLKEIDDALKLLWSSNVDSKKVNLGIANYGRGYTVANKNCMYYGCRYTGPSKAGSCTLQEGVLSTCEIRRLINEKHLEWKVIDGGAEVNEVSWDDQWIAFDDADTLGKKLELANDRCLGGTSLWAIDYATCPSDGISPQPGPGSSIAPSQSASAPASSITGSASTPVASTQGPWPAPPQPSWSAPSPELSSTQDGSVAPSSPASSPIATSDAPSPRTSSVQGSSQVDTTDSAVPSSIPPSWPVPSSAASSGTWPPAPSSAPWSSSASSWSSSGPKSPTVSTTLGTSDAPSSWPLSSTTAAASSSSADSWIVPVPVPTSVAPSDRTTSQAATTTQAPSTDQPGSSWSSTDQPRSSGIWASSNTAPSASSDVSSSSTDASWTSSSDAATSAPASSQIDSSDAPVTTGTSSQAGDSSVAFVTTGSNTQSGSSGTVITTDSTSLAGSSGVSITTGSGSQTDGSSASSVAIGSTTLSDSSSASSQASGSSAASVTTESGSSGAFVTSDSTSRVADSSAASATTDSTSQAADSSAASTTTGTTSQATDSTAGSVTTAPNSSGGSATTDSSAAHTSAGATSTNSGGPVPILTPSSSDAPSPTTSSSSDSQAPTHHVFWCPDGCKDLDWCREYCDKDITWPPPRKCWDFDWCILWWGFPSIKKKDGGGPECKLLGCGCGWMGLPFGPGCKGDFPFPINIIIELFGLFPDPCMFWGCNGSCGILGCDGWCFGVEGCIECPKLLCPKGGPKPGPPPGTFPPAPLPGPTGPGGNPEPCDPKEYKTATEQFVYCGEYVSLSSAISATTISSSASTTASTSTSSSSTCHSAFDVTLFGCHVSDIKSTTTTSVTKSNSLSSETPGPACTRAPLSLDDDEGNNIPLDWDSSSSIFASNTTDISSPTSTSDSTTSASPTADCGKCWQYFDKTCIPQRCKFDDPTSCAYRCLSDMCVAPNSPEGCRIKEPCAHPACPTEVMGAPQSNVTLTLTFPSGPTLTVPMTSGSVMSTSSSSPSSATPSTSFEVGTSTTSVEIGTSDIVKPTPGPMDQKGQWKVTIHLWMENNFSKIEWELYDPNGNWAGQSKMFPREGTDSIFTYIESDKNRATEHHMLFGVNAWYNEPTTLDEARVEFEIQKDMPDCDKIRGVTCKPKMITENRLETKAFFVDSCWQYCSKDHPERQLLKPSDLNCDDLNEADWYPAGNSWMRNFNCYWKGF